MPLLGSIKRRDLIAALRQLGFSGPYAGGPHQYMAMGTKKLHIPNPHQSEISVGLLRRILAQGGISVDEWEAV